MRLSGLSNQHKSLVGLFEQFPEEDERDCDHYIVPTVGRLIRHLLTIDGPDLWIGSSLSVLNFVARDTTHQADRVPSLAYAYTTGSCYFIEYPPPPELNIPVDAMIRFIDEDVERAGDHLLQAIEHSDANPKRITASRNWYVCPRCDYHHARYETNCVRCGYHFPGERKCQMIGIYRLPKIPEGAIPPNQAPHTKHDGKLE